MSASLRTTLALAGLIATVPAVGIASAHGDERRDDSPQRPCLKKDRGKGYEAKGQLAEGSVIEQVAGADTLRRSDDRFSGTLVVNVKKGNKRGRKDKGLASFTLTAVRLKGLVDGELPPVGTRLELHGKMPRTCVTPVVEDSSETAIPQILSTTPEESEDSPKVTDDSGMTEPTKPESTTAPESGAATASLAVIKKVEFKRSREARGSDDKPSTKPVGEAKPKPVPDEERVDDTPSGDGIED